VRKCNLYPVPWRNCETTLPSSSELLYVFNSERFIYCIYGLFKGAVSSAAAVMSNADMYNNELEKT
jgi:hypothetical protein